MSSKKQLFINAIAACCAVPLAATASDDVPGTEAHVNNLEVGVGYVSDDAWKFGQYNGLYEKGPYLIADIDYKKKTENRNYLDIRGTNLGLESRYLRVDAGVQGQQEYYFVYDELPSYQNNTAQTPYLGVDSPTLTLPAGYTPADMNAYMNSLELKTRRERFDLGAAFLSSKHWKFDVKVSHQNKTGVVQSGSTLAPTSSGSIVAGTVSALLPAPVDYKTNIMDAGIHYSGEKSNFSLIYQVSLFDNDNSALVWQNPYAPTVPATSDYGRMALAPSNQLHQISFNGGYTFDYRTRITGIASVGRSTQNETLQPFDVNGVGGPLPRSSAEAEVWLTKLGLRITSRVTQKLRLSGEYRYDGRDNQTPVDNWNYVIADGLLASDVGKTATNTPLSWQKHLLDLEANYRLTSRSSLQGGYKYAKANRQYEDAEIEREQTVEQSLLAKWKYRPTSIVDFAIYGEAGNRSGSNYTAMPTENPALRKFYLADRQRGMLGGRINLMPTNRLNLGLKVEYMDDDYQNSEIGLTAATQGNATLDLSYLIAENFTTYAYYTYENISSDQAGQGTTSGPGLGTDTLWQANIDDRINTVGLGAKITKLNNKWDIGADLTYNNSTGTIDLQSADPALSISQYPDLTTSLSVVQLWTTYRYNKQLTYKLSYWFQDYKADNWAVDGLEPDSISNLLLMGEETLDYHVHVIGASAIYSF
jgi:MtrB/PioB family decaheme-associated outer membrane protein